MNAEYALPVPTSTSCLKSQANEVTAPPKSPPGFQSWWWGLALVIVALLWVLLGLLHQQASHQAAADVGNINRVLEPRLQSFMHDAQTSLQGVASRIDEHFLRSVPSPVVGPWQMQALSQRFPQLGHFDVLDAGGNFLFDSDGLTYSPTPEQERFRGELAAQRISDLTQPPSVIGHDAAAQVLYLAVPIFEAEQHIGWVSTNLSLKPIRDAINEIDVGPNGVITLRRTDMPGALLRAPHSPVSMRTYRNDAIDDLLADGKQQDTLVINSRVDGIKRLYGFKRIGEFPLVLVTGLATKDYLLGWRFTAVVSSLVCGLLYVLIIGLTVKLRANRARRQQIMDELRLSALQDELTSLPNRRFLLQRVGQAINSCAENQHLSLLYFDLDNFKTINDTLGHVAGDLILQRLAQRLHALKPTVDTVARLGGDEFLVLVDDDDPERLSPLVSRMLQVIEQPLEVYGHSLTVTASAGIALYPAHGDDFGSLLKAADMALGQAKRIGRNTWAFYEPAMGARELRLLLLQNHLRQAFLNHQLQVHYQPQIDLQTRKVIGAEALLRWSHPEQGPVSPGEFIPVAESSGLILPISRWLLTQACQQAIAWQEAGFGELCVAVNCSAVQFRQSNLVKEVRTALNESGLKPSLLELELTESILIEHSEAVMENIYGLKALGVRMSIDDFGTGYSSMAYLKRFAVDKLKIDQSFVRAMLGSPQDAAIVQAVITLGHSFAMKVIAEGVEDDVTLRALIQKGCDEAQGYMFSKALSPAAFDAFMRKGMTSGASNQIA
jgi:diguanylate cyclase (GGDEF)-like protein